MRDLVDRLAELLGLLRGGSLPSASMSSLDRSVAAAGAAHLAARRALAVAVAEEARETERRESLIARASDLEARAVEAIRADREDLALKASEAIAAMRTEIAASERAAERFAAEVTLARREVDAQRHRLNELDRGRRLVRVGAALRASATRACDPDTDCFAEAEASLAAAHAENADARAMREEMAPPAERLIGRMAQEGFGPSIGVRGSDVMEQLRVIAVRSAPLTLISPRPPATEAPTRKENDR